MALIFNPSEISETGLDASTEMNTYPYSTIQYKTKLITCPNVYYK